MLFCIFQASMFCQRRVACCLRPSLIQSRFCSSKDDEGPPPWAARQVPQGMTFKAIYLTKSQNRAYKVYLFTIVTQNHIIFSLSELNEEGSGSVVESLTWDGGARVRASPSSLRCCPWARHIYPSLVLVQSSRTRPCLTEGLLMGRKESNQTNK